MSALGNTSPSPPLANPEPISNDDWEDLLKKIDEGRCTPFLGAGANIDILPTGTDLAKKWAADFEYPFRGKTDLPGVSQYMAVTKDDPLWPKLEVLRHFRQLASKVNLRTVLHSDSPLSVLADLPFSVYMTTNYDNFLHQALKIKNKNVKVEVCPWNRTIKETFPSVFAKKNRFSPSSDNPVVFHLHGYQDSAQSLVLTEDDYYLFLTSMSDLKLPPRIQESWRGSTLLFIGYRMADISFQVLFRTVLKGIDPSLRFRNLAVQLPPEDGPAAQQYQSKYFGKAMTNIYWGDVTQFSKELRTRWERFKK